MYEEIAPKQSGVIWNILLIVGGGFLLLSLPNIVPAPFAFPYVKAVYDFAVLCCLCFFVFRFIRRYSTEYKYRLDGHILTISGKIGAKETVYAELSLDGSVALKELWQMSTEEQKKYGNLKRISYGVSDKKKAYLLVHPMQNGDSAFVFQPSDEFVKVLQQIIS